MNKLFESIYGRKELERRTRLFYEAYARNSCNIENVFIESYDIKYELVFGKTPFQAAVYSLLRKYYRNEFYIKKSFVIHELMQSQSVTFTEYPISDSRADIVSVNGHSSAYEIKTHYDSLARLKKQISDYSKCFEYVYVICSDTKADKIEEIIPKHCGIYTYCAAKCNSSFIKKRNAILSPLLCSNSILKSMSKEELLGGFGITRREEIAARYSLEYVNEVYKKTLKIRYTAKWENFKAECRIILDN